MAEDIKINEENIEKKDNENEENIEVENTNKEKKKKKWLLLLLLLMFFLLFVFSFVIVITVNPHLSNSWNDFWINFLKIDTPTAPIIGGGSEEWAKSRLIYVEKDAKNFDGLSHYEYCVREEKSNKNCNWQKTITKNTEVSVTGKYYVSFRGVSKSGKAGKESNLEIVWIDNEAPIILKINHKITKEGLKIIVGAEDKESGIKDYFYKINESEFVIDDHEYIVENPVAGMYKLKLKVQDLVGNEKVVEQTFMVTEEDLKYPDDSNGSETLDPDNSNPNDSNPSDPENPNPSDPENPNPSDPENPNPNDPENPNPNDPENPNPGNPDDDEELPQIDLNEVPVKFTYGEEYDLPSHVSFGPSGGTHVCKVKEQEYKNTKDLPLGEHLIECWAYGAKGTTVYVNKLVNVEAKSGSDEAFNGWITITLYYPEHSTHWQWRIGDANSAREEDWLDYTGPITVRIEDVKNIYLRYQLGDQDIIIPPAGRVLVNIDPESYSLKKDEQTKVSIVYDAYATKREYRINQGEWQEYTGSFMADAGDYIEAKVTKDEKVYNEAGDYILTRTLTDFDSVNISIHSSSSSGGGTGDIDGPGDTIIDTKPNLPDRPSYYLKGPDIAVDPSEVVEEAKVIVTPQEPARTIYIQIGNQDYQKYEGPISIDKNTAIKAYYIRESDGKISDVSYFYVNNIKQPTLPYIKMESNPGDLLNSSVSSVTVTISGNDYHTLEYSLDGYNYQNYDQPILITKPTTVYARAINENGIQKETLVVSKIVDSDSSTPIKPSVPEHYAIEIFADPDYTSSSKMSFNTKISIVYDSRATKKTYRIGNGEEKEYTGPFEINKNATIYAFAYSDKGNGSAYKMIDFLSEGIAAPTIIPDVEKGTTSSLKVKVVFDRNAVTKKVKIGNGDWFTYTDEFTVNENTTIYAYNENILGERADSSYEIMNIVPKKPSVIIDYGQYFLIKLNYPENSENREYKWTKEGTWTSYKEEGILLIKKEFENDILKDGEIQVQIKDENGKLIDFNGDYYVVTQGFQELMENLFMRWGYVKPGDPVIKIEPTSPTQKVIVTIDFGKSLYKQQYKFINDNGEDSGWLEYNGPFEISSNGKVFTKAEDYYGSSTNIVKENITNIDHEKPSISLQGNFEVPKNNIAVLVSAADNYNVSEVKWTFGKETIEFFHSNGNLIQNKQTISITENGTYTFYAKDQAGNETILIKEITNIDKTPPAIVINILTQNKGTTAEIEIDYGNATTKQYRIGENSTTWLDYNGKITITSKELVSNGWVNEDGSFTIYAKGKNDPGNEMETSEKSYILYTDYPAKPSFNNMGMGYAIIKLSGIENDQRVVITYPNADTINTFSLDGGKTWNLYEGEFTASTSTIIARSTSKESGLYTEASYNISVPKDAVLPEAYDGNMATYQHPFYPEVMYNPSLYINIDKSMWNQKIFTSVKGGTYDKMSYIFLDETGKVLQNTTYEIDGYGISTVINVPANSTRLQIYYPQYAVPNDNYPQLYEIQVANEPIIKKGKEVRPLITSAGVVKPYTEVTIDYSLSSVKRLYKIGENGEWQEYQDRPIRLEADQTIYAKGIDAQGRDTRLTPSYKATLSKGVVPKECYDGDVNTFPNIWYPEQVSNASNYINVDQSMWNQNILVTAWVTGTGSQHFYFVFQNASGTEIGRTSINYNKAIQTVKMLIPSGTTQIRIYWDSLSTPGDNTGFKLYEIGLADEPIISRSKEAYGNITFSGIEDPYHLVTIKYFPISKQRLYKIGENGEWQEYQDKEIRLEKDEVIYAKGIDANGKETRIVSTYQAKFSDAVLTNEAYDGNETTFPYPFYSYQASYPSKFLSISKEMWGQTISTYVYNGSNWQYLYYQFIDANGNALLSQKIGSGKTRWSWKIPENATHLQIYWGGTYTSGDSKLEYHYPNIYEIRVVPQTYNEGPVSQPEPSPIESEKTYEAPAISISDMEWGLKKEVNIQSSSEGILEYSLDLGKTWNSYTEKIILDKPTTVFTRLIVKGKIVSTSSYKVTKIDFVEPKISLDIPERILKGDSYELPTSVSYGESGGNVKCYTNEIEIDNTKDLKMGEYLIVCRASSTTGLESRLEKTITVEEVIEEESPKPEINIPEESPIIKEEENNESSSTESSKTE